MGGDLLNHRWYVLRALRADCSSEMLRPRHLCSGSGLLGAGWGPRWRGSAEARRPGSCQLACRWPPATPCTRPLRRGLEDPPPLTTLQMWRAHFFVFRGYQVCLWWHMFQWVTINVVIKRNHLYFHACTN